LFLFRGLPSPDSSGKPFEMENQFLLFLKSDPRSSFKSLQKWFGMKKLATNSWNSFLKIN